MELNLPQSIPAEMVSSREAMPANQAQAIFSQAPRPVSHADRIRTIDMIRGLALLGILMMNIPGFGIDPAVFNRLITGSHNNADYYTFSTVMILFEGTMRGLFSMLFGAGMILFMQNKAELPGNATVAEYYYRRLLWLVGFGLFNAYVLLWFGDILFFYGLCGMLLFPFRKMRPKWLLAIGIACLFINIISPLINYGETREKRSAYKEAAAARKAHRKLTPDQQKALTTWQEMEKNSKPDPERSKTNVEKIRGSYGTVFSYFISRNENDEIWGMYMGSWDMLCMMFIGMAMLGTGFFTNRLPTSTYGITLLLGYSIGILLSWCYLRGLETSITRGISAYTDAYRVPHWILYDFRRVFLSVGHASLLMVIYRAKLVPWLMKALANVGQMAFTNYLMQSIICTLFFYGYGLGYYDTLRFHQMYYVVGTVWIFQLIFSSVWLRYFRFGPFEWIWRSLTYWTFQPMLIRKQQVKAG